MSQRGTFDFSQNFSSRRDKIIPFPFYEQNIATPYPNCRTNRRRNLKKSELRLLGPNCCNLSVAKWKFSCSGLCARFQSDPRESHLTVVKRIFRYLKGTTNLGLLYRKSLDYKLVGCCDADFAGDRIERKSTSGNCQFLGENLISWASKRQATIAMSTAEAEYISAASCCTQLLWMKHQLEDYQITENVFPLLW